MLQSGGLACWEGQPKHARSLTKKGVFLETSALMGSA